MAQLRLPGGWSMVDERPDSGKIMNKTSLVFMLLLPTGALFAQDDSNWKTQEVVPGIHMLESDRGFAGGNLGLLTGDDGVVLIDDGMPTITATTVAAVEALTGDPVNFVINTHAHGDHTGANAVFMEKGATVVVHDNLRQALTEDEQYDQSALPELTFSDSVTFHLNGHTAYVFHIPSAHTSGDAAIHFTDVNVIHTGDVMFNGMFPFIDLDGGGSVDGFIAGQQKLHAMADDQTKIIPGHGPLANKADLKAAIDMLIDARAMVEELVDEGLSLEDVQAANPLGKYQSWNWDFITTEVMTETIYRSLTE
jgi:glyoxylase-like metal-dependent hydrolase (beta-lactamase superfamily II)